MAYVQPNSVIQFFKGINLDNRYLHTIYFASESAQNTWFSGKVAKSIQGHSYQRYTINQIKVKGDATEFLDLSYMRFKNDRGVDMWFYAFINSVEYINENNVLITYEIDVMQTWFIQKGSIRPCMVLREHVNDDTFGAHLESEPIGSDSYKAEFLVKSGHFEDFSLVEFNSANPSDFGSVPFNNDLFVGTGMSATPCPDANAASNIVTALNILFDGDWDIGTRKVELVDMFTFPSDFCHQNKNQNTYAIQVTDPFSYGNYTPKNKKLLTYPYNYLYGTTMDGENAIYRWEYFDGLYVTSPTVIFHAYGSPVGGGMITCYPDLYNGIDDNHDVALNINNFPKNPFTIDSYQAWVAAGGKTKLEIAEAFTNIRGFTALASSGANSLANMTSGLANLGSSAIDMGGTNTPLMRDLSGATMGASGIIGGVTSYINTALNVAEAKNKINYAWANASYHPNAVKGTSTPNLSVPLRSLDFHFFNVHIRENEARHIDDFFSCYGYAVHKVKQPNITGRQYWNFVQTENCVIDGNIPASSKDAIGRIFDGGITFWHNGDNVGNYGISITNGSINNPII